MQLQKATAVLSSPAVVAAVASSVFHFLLSWAVWHFDLCLKHTTVLVDCWKTKDFLLTLILPVFLAAL